MNSMKNLQKNVTILSILSTWISLLYKLKHFSEKNNFNINFENKYDLRDLHYT